MNNNSPMRAYTHTLQMVSQDMLLPMEEINQQSYMTKKVKHTQRGILYAINPNKFTGRDIDSLSELQYVLDIIRQELLIDEWELDRQDIAIDIKVPYEDVYKLNKMLVSLFSLYRNEKNVTIIDDAMTLKKRALTCAGRKYELQIYDKNEESGGKYPYSRCEFRFKLLDIKSRDNMFKTLYKTLSALPKLINQLNKRKIDVLYNKWLKESSPDYPNTPVKSLPEFFRRYGNDIFTVDIARGLYEEILNGNYSNWIKRYRQGGCNIHFIKKCEIESYCRNLKKAVQLYVKKEWDNSTFSSGEFNRVAA